MRKFDSPVSYIPNIHHATKDDTRTEDKGTRTEDKGKCSHEEEETTEDRGEEGCCVVCRYDQPQRGVQKCGGMSGTGRAHVVGDGSREQAVSYVAPVEAPPHIVCCRMTYRSFLSDRVH